LGKDHIFSSAVDKTIKNEHIKLAEEARKHLKKGKQFHVYLKYQREFLAPPYIF
jgi:hypothetical protein